MKYKIYKKNINVGEITIKNQIEKNTIKLLYEEISFNDYKTIKVNINRNKKDYRIQYSSLREKITYEECYSVFFPNKLIILPWELYLFFIIDESKLNSNLVLDTINWKYCNVRSKKINDHILYYYSPMQLKVILHNNCYIEEVIDCFNNIKIIISEVE